MPGHLTHSGTPCWSSRQSDAYLSWAEGREQQVVTASSAWKMWLLCRVTNWRTCRLSWCSATKGTDGTLCPADRRAEELLVVSVCGRGQPGVGLLTEHLQQRLHEGQRVGSVEGELQLPADQQLRLQHRLPGHLAAHRVQKVQRSLVVDPLEGILCCNHVTMEAGCEKRADLRDCAGAVCWKAAGRRRPGGGTSPGAGEPESRRTSAEDPRPRLQVWAGLTTL